MGQWFGMLFKAPGDHSPDVRIRAGLGEPAVPEERFGLSEDQRRAIFTRIIQAEDRAEAESDRRFPDPNDFMKQAELAQRLTKENKAALAEELGLTAEELRQVAVEALTKNWPMPRRD